MPQLGSSFGLESGIFSSRRVRLVRQVDWSECGLACLTMVTNFFGDATSLAQLRHQFPPSIRGTSLKSIISISDRIGLTSRAVKLSLDALGALALPAILHWDMNHFVVLEAVSRRGALIHDPAGRSGWMPLAQVSEHFTGIGLELTPASSFTPVKRPERLQMSQLWSRLRGLKRAVAQTILLSSVLEACALAAPYYLQVAVDVALPGGDLGLLNLLAIGFGLVVLLNAAAMLLRSFVLLSVGAAFSFGLASNLSRRLFRLPISWFERRHIGDITSRFQSITPMRQLLTEDAPATLIDGILALLTLGLMATYSLGLASIAVGFTILSALVRALAFRFQRRAQEDTLVSSSREQSVLMETLRGIRTLRLSGREVLRHAVWQSRLTDSTNATIRLQRIVNWQNAAISALTALEAVASVWLAMRLVLVGSLSLGMVMAFMAYKAQFVTAASSLLQKGVSLRMIALHLDRVSDIALTPEDVCFGSASTVDAKISGRIELIDVSFRYGPDEPLVLQNVNLIVEAGESIAITGPSGGGKSTLIQLMLGLLEPTAGQILIDGLPLKLLGYHNYYNQLGVVLQDDTLFAGSIIENIAMFDENPSLDQVTAAAKAAAIASDIQAMPMAYETMVGDMGAALSGGQKQRLLLARALYRLPRILVVDEGTSALDEERERQVNAAVAGMGITRVIVAHRKETVASAARRYLLRDGNLSSLDAGSDEASTPVAHSMA